MHSRLAMAATALALLAAPAQAATIIGFGAPVDAIPGGTVEDFEGAALGTFGSLTLGNVTYSRPGDDVSIGDFYSGQYNTTGRSLENQYDGGPDIFRFDFASAVNAFAFNFGASDDVWTLTAYDIGGSVLDSLFISPPLTGSNAGEYFGIAATGIAYAILIGGVGNDYVFIDNFTTDGVSAAVPLPASLPLLMLGLGGIAVLRRRRG